MKIIKKSQLLDVLKEQFDMDEMAARSHPKSRPIEFGGQTVGHRLKSGSKEDILNKENLPLPAYVVVYTCGEEVQNFINSHPDMIEHIKKTYVNPETSEFPDVDVQHPEIIFTNAEKCPKYNPYQGPVKHYFDAKGNEIEPGIPSLSYKEDVKTGEKYTLKEAINRKLKAALFGTKDTRTGEVINPGLMYDAELNEHMTECSIPSFKVRERSYEDRHDTKNTNQRVHYGSDSFILYESANDFLGDVLKRTYGLESDVKRRETHLARLRNQLYRKWDSKKKNEKKYEGITDIYKLEKRGYSEQNYDVNIMSKFDVLGTLTNQNTFVWRLKLDVLYGKKIPVENLISSRNVRLFKNIDEVKVVELPEGTSFPEVPYTDEVGVNEHVLGNSLIMNGLMEALQEFKDKIMEISTDDALEMANYFQYEIGEEPEGGAELAESFDRMIKHVLKEAGMKKTVRIKESDLIRLLAEHVVKGLTEQERFDDFITKGKKNEEEMDNEQQNVEPDNQEAPEGGNNAVQLTIGKDDKGNYFIIKDADTDHAKIIAKTK